MSANFWGSTHGQNWMLHEKTLRVSKKTDLKYISETDLIRLRCLFVHLITKLGRRLGVRQVVIATAWTYFKRFYSKNGFRLTDPTLVAATCVYLACKMEESPHHIKVITNEIRTLLSNDYGIQYPYDNQKLAEMEFYLLEELEFNMVVFHPYRTLMRVAREFGSRNEVIQRAWEIVNDSYKTDVCLQYPPHLIAYAALVIAAAAPDGGRTRSSRNNTTTAAKAADGPTKDLRKYLSEWHVDLSKVTRIVRELVRFYSNWSDYHENHKAIHAYRKLKHHAGDKTDDPTSVASDNRAELDRTDPDDLDDLELTGVEEVDRAIKEFSSKLGKQRKRNRGGIVNDLDVELGRWWEQSAYQHASTAATPSAPVQTATPNVTRKRP